MTESEFLERFDAHIAETRVLNSEIREEMRLSREQHADLRAFTRDLTRRNEIVLGEIAQSMRDMQAEIGDVRLHMADTLEQSRAHTATLLNVLDRLN